METRRAAWRVIVGFTELKEASLIENKGLTFWRGDSLDDAVLLQIIASQRSVEKHA